MDQREVERLIIAAEGRMDTATAELLLAIKGIKDAATSQNRRSEGHQGATYEVAGPPDRLSRRQLVGMVDLPLEL